MAHKGNRYPLWFRRDFGVNQFNSSAYARRYNVIVGPFVTPVQPVGLFFHFVATNDDKEAGDTRSWDFNVLAIGGIQWSGSMRIMNDPVDGWLDTRVIIATNVVLLAWAGIFSLAEKQYTYDQYGNALLTKVLLATPTCSTGGFADLSATAAPWDQP